ncbi:MAG: heavy metal-associated domain-containing protein [Candidatus Levybacteria bacterium]|nr:heavy metal-associated domain-containing protein [Candidatus Levybacteria bacterium]
MSNLTTVKLKIEGMHCTSCAMNIDFDLEDIKGVKKSQTSYARQETVVEFDDTITKQSDLINQVKKTGYKAVLNMD